MPTTPELACPPLSAISDLARRVAELRAESRRVIAETEAAIRQSRGLIATARADGGADTWIIQFLAGPQSATEAPRPRAETEASTPYGGLIWPAPSPLTNG
jgi:hypothetical protein